ncbi:MAG TPA: HNH endonuclease signature motif containing protein, partial [Actinomycetales bacterium]|nr:HNH endonuclease signature motif containing protein [Actinomycetales bacterium]
TTRLATAAQRRALAARDKGCVIPGCTRPANQCDAHHVVFWSHGGNTNLDELVLLCGPHHNAVHAGIIEIQMRDGIPYVRSRTTMGRQREWTRNRLHDHAKHASRLGAQLRLDHQLDLNPHLAEQLRAVQGQGGNSDPPDGEPPPDSG